MLLHHPWSNDLGLNQTSEKRRLTQFSIEILLENLSTWHTPIPTSRTVSESWPDLCRNLNSHIFKLAKNKLRYDASTWDYGILFRNHGSAIFSGFVDSHWGGEISSGSFTTSLVFRLGSSPVSSFSKKQASVFHRKCMQGSLVASNCRERYGYWRHHAHHHLLR